MDRIVAAVRRLPYHFKHIAQKKMVLTTFDTRERTPHRMLGRKALPGNETGALNRGVTAGHLGRERQKELVQTVLGEEVAHQLRPALQQDNVALPDGADCLQD